LCHTTITAGNGRRPAGIVRRAPPFGELVIASDFLERVATTADTMAQLVAHGNAPVPR
jgi:hypothetical protein